MLAIGLLSVCERRFLSGGCRSGFSEEEIRSVRRNFMLAIGLLSVCERREILLMMVAIGLLSVCERRFLAGRCRSVRRNFDQ